MPYKDKEKQRKAQREYDEKRKDKRGEVWCIVIYPESMPENWREILDSLHVPIVVSPLHDKDVNADGELKKPHHHVAIHFDAKKSFDQVKGLADMLHAPSPMKQDSWRGICRYLCHLDNPEKARYSEYDVVCLGGADYLSIIGLASDKYEVIGEIIDWIETPGNDEIHRDSYWNLLKYCKDNNERWYRALCDNCSRMFIEGLKSRHWTWEQDMRQSKEAAFKAQAEEWRDFSDRLDADDLENDENTGNNKTPVQSEN